jgi:demethylmenaquinone methyltransferase/2-methoxy-6-polyprenyl-1,4-benzoquinol methylase
MKRGANVADSNQDNAQERIEVSYLGMAEAIHQVTEPAIRAATEALGLPPGSRGLDVGCGIGTHTRWLVEAVAPGGHVTGVDISRQHLAQAEAKANQAGLAEQVSFQHGNVNELPFDADSFDWVWNVDMLYVGPGMPIQEPVPVLKELGRVAKPGGTVAILFWSSQKLLPGYPLLEARLNACPAANYPYTDDTQPASHILRCLSWLQAAGLEQPQVRTFVAGVHAPLSETARNGLTATFQMFWQNVQAELRPEDWAALQRLCQPKSPDFILNLPDYYAFITYSMFQAMVPG